MAFLNVTAVALRIGGAPIPPVTDLVKEQTLWLAVSVDDDGTPITGLDDGHFAVRIVRPPATAIAPVTMTSSTEDGDPVTIPMVTAVGLDGFYAVNCLRPWGTFLATEDHAVEVAVTAPSGARGQTVVSMPWPRELLALSLLNERLEQAAKSLRWIMTRLGAPYP